jgi:mRNA interferase HicA
MTRRALDRELLRIASAHGRELVFQHGAKHDKAIIGERSIIIPRHAEINEHTARQILRDAEEAAR